MVTVLPIMWAALTLLQTEDGAAALLREVAESARSVRTWKIEGSVESSEDLSAPPAIISFLQRSPSETRFSQTGGRTPAMVVCDGTNIWTYSPPLHRFTKSTAAVDSSCSAIVDTWKGLPAVIDSPSLEGESTFTSNGQTIPCSIVGGSSAAELPSAGRLVRTFCIDKVRHLVAWETIKSKWNSRKYVYTSVETNIEISPRTFSFDPPIGTTLSEFALPIPKPPGSPELPREIGVTAPRVRSMKQPKYDGASLKKRIEGTVTLYVVVSDDGVPSDLAVFRSLSPGLDENAVKTVSQWRFQPAMRNGVTVAAAVLIEVNYRIQP